MAEDLKLKITLEGDVSQLREQLREFERTPLRVPLAAGAATAGGSAAGGGRTAQIFARTAERSDATAAESQHQSSAARSADSQRAASNLASRATEDRLARAEYNRHLSIGASAAYLRGGTAGQLAFYNDEAADAFKEGRPADAQRLAPRINMLTARNDQEQFRYAVARQHESERQDQRDFRTFIAQRRESEREAERTMMSEIGGGTGEGHFGDGAGRDFFARAAGGGGGRGGGGVVRGGSRLGYLNPFSSRGVSRLLGSAALVYGTLEAATLATGLLNAADTEAHPERLLRQWTSLNSPYSAMNDPVLGQLAGRMASEQASGERRQAIYGIPVIGTLGRLADSFAGVEGRQLDRVSNIERNRDLYGIEQQDEYHNQMRGAILSRDPLRQFDVEATRREQINLNRINQSNDDEVQQKALHDWQEDKRLTGVERGVLQQGVQARSGTILAGEYASLMSSRASRATLTGDTIGALNARQSGEEETLRAGIAEKMVGASDLDRTYLQRQQDASLGAIGANYDVQRADVTRRLNSNSIQFRGNTAANFAAANNDPITAGFIGTVTAVRSRTAGAQPNEQAMAAVEGVSEVIAHLAETARQLQYQTADIQGSTAANRMILLRDPLGAQFQRIEDRRNASLRYIPDSPIATLLTGGLNKRLRGAINENADSEEDVGAQEREDQRSKISRGLQTRSDQLRSLLDRDPYGANIAGIVGKGFQEQEDLKNQGWGRNIQRHSLENSLDELRLGRQQYGDAFRGTAVDLRTTDVTNPRDSEDPSRVLGEFNRGMQQMLDAIKALGDD